MTSTRSKLVLLPNGPALDSKQIQTLQSVFEVEAVENLAAAQRVLLEDPCACVVGTPDQIETLHAAAVPGLPIVQYIAQGVGIVDAGGTLTWMNTRLRQVARHFVEQFIAACISGRNQLNDQTRLDTPIEHRPSVAVPFEFATRRYRVLVSAASADEHDSRKVGAVVGVLYDVTESQHLRDRISQINDVGLGLLQLEAASLCPLNMAERLRLVEQRILSCVKELFGYEHFEIRLVNRKTNQLELVIAVGLLPLKIGEAIFAQPTGNGICGRVASSGEAYLCEDVTREPLYREGLEGARSSLTVPLRLAQRVTGVFNAESTELTAFTHEELVLVEQFGRYVAAALNMLDLLVVERYTTHERLVKNVLGDLDRPLDQIGADVQELRGSLQASPLRERVDRIAEAAMRVRAGVDQCAAGPRTILDAEQELHREQPDPAMIGKRVLVADDEPAIRDTINIILKQRGCDVTVCPDGKATVEAIHATTPSAPFDLVISDIKMPDRNGYEVFRAAREVSADTPVILMTGFGYDPHHSIVRASQEGLHSFLFKPFQVSQLLEEVTKALVARK